MSRTYKVIAIAVAAFLSLILIVSCNQRQVYMQPAAMMAPAVVGQAPVIVQQPVVVGGSHDGFFTGMMMGHMFSGGGYGSSHTTTIVHAPAAAPAPVYRAPAPTYTPRPSYTTNSRGVSTSVSRSGGISVSSGRRR